MPSKKVPCPKCGNEKAAKSKLCRKCSPPYERTAEHRAKLSEAAKKPRLKARGRKRPEHSAAMKALWADPERREAARQRGVEMASDPAWCKRIAESVSGEKNPRWKGGISKQEYAPGFSRSLRRRIRKRDGFKCQLCGITEQEARYNFSIHHADYDKSNHDEDNLFTTCKGCNSRVNTNRESWTAWFAFTAEVRRQTGKHLCDLFGRQVIAQHEGVIVKAFDGGIPAVQFLEDFADIR